MRGDTGGSELFLNLTYLPFLSVPSSFWLLLPYSSFSSIPIKQIWDFRSKIQDDEVGMKMTMT